MGGVGRVESRDGVSTGLPTPRTSEEDYDPLVVKDPCS